MGTIAFMTAVRAVGLKAFFLSLDFPVVCCGEPNPIHFPFYNLHVIIEILKSKAINFFSYFLFYCCFSFIWKNLLLYLNLIMLLLDLSLINKAINKLILNTL